MIRADQDAALAAPVLAASTSPAALEEALRHLRPTLFRSDDPIASDAAEILQLALAERRHVQAA